MKKQPSVLIVEDDESNRLCLRDFLEHQGYACHEAENGADGLAKLQTEPFDLVMTDLNMPIMNGYQLLEAIASSPALRHLPVLITTGQSLSKVKQQLTPFEVHDVLSKPYDFSEISRLLNTLFK